MIPLPTPIRHALLLLACTLLAGVAHAQTIPAQLAWNNPTTSVDGVPLTGANAVTGIEVHWSTAPIPDDALTRAPQVTLGAVTATTQTVAATNGSTVYFRLRALNAGGKSGFSNQASKVVSLSTVPNPPSSLSIVFVVSQAADGSVSFEMALEAVSDFGPGDA